MRQLVYIAHPVRGDVQANIARVLRWYRWLTITQPGPVYCIPWLPDVLVFDDAKEVERAAGMARNLVHLQRCDAIALVGGVLSSGMRAERDEMLRLGRPVVDYLHHGAEPPVIP